MASQQQGRREGPQTTASIQRSQITHKQVRVCVCVCFQQTSQKSEKVNTFCVRCNFSESARKNVKLWRMPIHFVMSQRGGGSFISEVLLWNRPDQVNHASFRTLKSAWQCSLGQLPVLKLGVRYWNLQISRPSSGGRSHHHGGGAQPLARRCSSGWPSLKCIWKTNKKQTNKLRFDNRTALARHSRMAL